MYTSPTNVPEESAESILSFAADTELRNLCPEAIVCPQDLKYAPIDGSCHNVRNPSWGKIDTPYQRASLINAYADGIFLDPFKRLNLKKNIYRSLETERCEWHFG